MLWEADVMLVSGSGCVSLKYIEFLKSHQVVCILCVHFSIGYTPTLLKKLKRRLSTSVSRKITKHFNFKHLKRQQWMHTMITVTL